MFPRLIEFKEHAPICQLSAAWLNRVQNMLDDLQIEMVAGQDHAEIISPKDTGKGWKFRIPGGSGSSATIDTTGATQYQVYQITDDTADPPTAGFDWVRAHA
jgi:hypothetical protein